MRRKLRLISKFMTPQTTQQIITVHILSNISGSKVNQTMKFGQLSITWEIFFWKIIHKMLSRSYSQTLLLKSILRISLNCQKYYKFVLIVCPNQGLPKGLEKGLEPVFPTYFLHDFWRKIFLMLCYSYWPNFIVWLPLHL